MLRTVSLPHHNRWSRNGLKYIYNALNYLCSYFNRKYLKWGLTFNRYPIKQCKIVENFIIWGWIWINTKTWWLLYHLSCWKNCWSTKMLRPWEMIMEFLWFLFPKDTIKLWSLKKLKKSCIRESDNIRTLPKPIIAHSALYNYYNNMVAFAQDLKGLNNLQWVYFEFLETVHKNWSFHMC